jgi:hypothetical protein
MAAHRFASLLLLLISIAASILLAEWTVRSFYPQRLYYNVSQWDPDVGHIPIPNIESHQIHPEYDMWIRINSRGMRDREFEAEKPPRTLRIGVFGDSFTFGEGVAAEDTYPKVLERLLSSDPLFKSAGWNVEVLNFGIGKQGTSQQLAWYRKEGRRYGLDIVVVGFLAGNDFGDNLAGVYRLVDGDLVHDAQAYSSVRRIQSIVYAIPGYRWASEHSHLLNLVRVVGTWLNDRGRSSRARVVGDEADRHAVDLTRRLIAQFREDVTTDSARFVMISLPARGQPPVTQPLASDVELYVRRLARLQPLLLEDGVDLLDLVPVYAVLPPEQYYFAVNGHMREAGHVVIAERLQQHIAPMLHERVVAGSVAAE